MNKTALFFVKNQKIAKITLNKKIVIEIFKTESDIFCKKNDIVNLSKCGEVYLFKSKSSKK